MVAASLGLVAAGCVSVPSGVMSGPTLATEEDPSAFSWGG